MIPFLRNRTSVFLLISLLGFFIFCICKDYSILYIYQSRDLARAKDLLGGEWLWHGPELSGGGFLPGNLYYLLLAAFIWIGGDWLSCWYGMLVLASLGGALVWLYLQNRFGKWVGVIWLLTYFTSPFNLISLSNFWNPSYTLLFNSLLFCAIIEIYAFSTSQLKLISGFVLLALSLQLHLTSLLFLSVILILQIMALNKKFLCSRPLHFFLALSVGILFLCPYLYSLINSCQSEFSDSSLQMKGYWQVDSVNTDSIFGLLPYWAQFHLLEIFVHWKRQVVQFGLVSAFKELSLAIILMAPLSLLVLLVIFSKIDLPRRDVIDQRIDWILKISLGITSLTALPLFFSLGFYSKYRYGMPFFLVLQFASTIWLGRIFDGPLKSKIRARTVLITFLFIGSLGLVASVSSVVRKSRTYAPSPFLMTEVMQFIQQTTCWSRQKMKEQIFAINIYNFISWDPLVREYCKEGRLFDGVDLKRPVAKLEQNISGILLVNIPSIKTNIDFNEGQWVDLLKRYRVERHLVNSIESGQLILNLMKKIGPIYILSLKPNVPFSPIVRFQNQGYPYGESELDREWKNLGYPLPSAIKIDDTKVLYRVNACPKKEQASSVGCPSGVLMEWIPTVFSATKLRVSVSSPSLSQPSSWIDPYSTPVWLEPFVEFTCQGSPVRLLLVEAIGIYSRGNPQLLNSAVLSPYTTEVPISCSGPISNMSWGIQSIRFVAPWGERRMPGFKISIPLDKIILSLPKSMIQ